MRYDKTQSFYNPVETTMVDDLPFAMKEKHLRDQRKAALLIVENVQDPQEQSDFLEMIGVKPYRSQSLYEKRLEAKRVKKAAENALP